MIFDILDSFGKYDSSTASYTVKQQNRFELIDHLFSIKNTLHHSEKTTCMCGCIETYDLISAMFRRCCLYDNQYGFENLQEFLNYCFEKKYIIRTSLFFQQKIINIIGDINHWAGMCSNRDAIVFEWTLLNILTPVSILTLQIQTKDNESIEKESLFHQLFRAYIEFEIDYKLNMFKFFDSINFNYKNPNHYNLITLAIEKYDIFSIEQLIKRGVEINTIEINNVLEWMITSMTCYLNYKYNNETTPKRKIFRLLFDKIYESSLLIHYLFANNINLEEKKNVILALYKYLLQSNNLSFENNEELFDDLDNCDIFVNNRIVKSREYYYDFLNVLKILSQNHFIFDTKVKELYIEGSKPIQELYYDIHTEILSIFETA